MQITQRIRDIQKRAAKLIRERGWTVGSKGWYGAKWLPTPTGQRLEYGGPLCIEGACRLAAGLESVQGQLYPSLDGPKEAWADAACAAKDAVRGVVLVDPQDPEYNLAMRYIDEPYAFNDSANRNKVLAALDLAAERPPGGEC